MNIIKTISSSYNTVLQRIVKFTRYGNADVQTSQQMAPVGIDSNPIEGMAAVYGTTDQLGKTIVLGYLQKNMIAAPGEVRIFAVDSNGAIQNTIHISNTGNIYIGVAKGTDFNNLVRFNELQTGYNQLRTDLNALITAYNAHTHISAAPGSPTTVPTPLGTPSTATITAAKTPKIYTT